MDHVCLECRGCRLDADDVDCERCGGSGIEPLHPDVADREARILAKLGEYVCEQRDRKVS
jgi:hypothetical protein